MERKKACKGPERRDMEHSENEMHAMNSTAWNGSPCKDCAPYTAPLLKTGNALVPKRRNEGNDSPRKGLIRMASNGKNVEQHEQWN